MPIVIPREPTLEELLNAARGEEPLERVQSLALTLISDHLSLQTIATYCPQLTTLVLAGSALNTLRELGCALENLRHLDVSRCGLRSLDGTSGLGSVTNLVANNNHIEYLDPCSFLDQLQELSVQGNSIRTTYNFHCLSLCPLRVLHIQNNPIEEQVEDFVQSARSIIPTLQLINGIRVREAEEEATCAEDSLLSSHSDTSSGSFHSSPERGCWWWSWWEFARGLR